MQHLACRFTNLLGCFLPCSDDPPRGYGSATHCKVFNAYLSDGLRNKGFMIKNTCWITTFQSFKGLKGRMRKPDLYSNLLSSKCLEVSSLPRASHSLCSIAISICFWFLALSSEEIAALTLSLLEKNVRAYSVLITSHFPPNLSEGENTQGHTAARIKEHLLAFSLGHCGLALPGEAQGFALRGWGISMEAG